MKLSIEHLSKNFGEKIALNDIHVELSTGVYGILGANGSGKTTFMRILASVSKATTGRILLDGQDIHVLNHQYREIIGYLPQHVGLYKSFTTEKFLMYIASLKGLTKQEAKKKVNEVIELVGLTDKRKEKTGKLSGGMKRRIGIAQALLNDPKILIVDEPTAGLDPKERIRFRNLLSQIADSRIVLLSTHIVSDIEFIAKEVLILKEGRLIKKETTQELLKGMKNKVWNLTVREEEVAFYQSRYKIGNIVRLDKDIQLRIIHEEKPNDHAKEEIPNLEDLYLYYFDEEVLV
ncbi:MAG: ABC transporter ATP-binding protein [Bacillus sp. (in: firmicutes)]